jgi:hypothetical protein
MGDFTLVVLAALVLLCLLTVVWTSLTKSKPSDRKGRKLIEKYLPKNTGLRLRYISYLEDCDIKEALERAIDSYYILRDEDDSSMACEESSSVSSQSLSLTFSRS